jgi:hypothetical protein
MKKLLSLIVVMVLAGSTFAQKATLMPLVAGDTVTNSGTVSKVLPVFTAGYSGVVIQPVLTKLSGTAAGTIILYESLDGTNYKSTGDTLTLTNVTTNTVVWKKTSPVPVYYKAVAGGGSSVSAVLRIYYVARKYDRTL